MAGLRMNSVSPGLKTYNFMQSTIGASSVWSSSPDVNLDNIETDDSAKAKQICKMVGVVLLPVVALISKTGVAFADSLDTLRQTSVLAGVMEHALFASEGIILLQKERGLTAIYLGTAEDDFASYRKLASARLKSNEFLLSFRVYDKIKLPATGKMLVTGKDILEHLDTIRATVDERNENTSLLEIVNRYTEVNEALIKDSVRESLVPSREDIWPLVVAFGVLARAIDAIGIQRGIGGAAFAGCGLNSEQKNAFSILESKYAALLNTAFQYFSPLRTQYAKDLELSGDLRKTLDKQKSFILNNTALAVICSSGMEASQGSIWFESVTSFIGLLTSLQRHVTSLIKGRLPVIESRGRSDMAAYLSVMISVSLISLLLGVWYSTRLFDLNRRVKEAVTKIRDRAEQVKEEKKKTDFLLYQMMPRRVADCLKKGMEVVPEWFDKVTVYFSDIVDWTKVCAMCSPHQVVSLLNTLYAEFDDIIGKYDVYKVETIADSYMCVSGLPEKTPDNTNVIAHLALEMIAFAKCFSIPHLPGAELKLRVGFHTGPVVTGIVGTKMPRYCLFGDTVNTASRMETNGEAFSIHISETCYRILLKEGGFEMKYRGRIQIKGKGEMATYWLIRSLGTTPKKRVTIKSQGEETIVNPVVDS